MSSSECRRPEVRARGCGCDVTWDVKRRANAIKKIQVHLAGFCVMSTCKSTWIFPPVSRFHNMLKR